MSLIKNMGKEIKKDINQVKNKCINKIVDKNLWKSTAKKMADISVTVVGTSILATGFLATAPILGLFSEKVRDRIYRYSNYSEMANAVSTISNIVIYPTIGHSLGNDTGFAIGVIYALFEAPVRLGGGSFGSLPGYLPSKIINYFGEVYDHAKTYDTAEIKQE